MTLRRRAELMLLVVTVCWGMSFPAIKLATPLVTPALFVAMRFVLASLVLLAHWPPICRGLPDHLRERPYRLLLDRVAWRWSLPLGILVTFGYVTQTVGMHTTSANNSAFITSLSVVLVPVLLFLRGVRPEPKVAVAVLVAVCGLMLMTRPDLGRLNEGDIWTLGCAFSYALYLIFLNDALDRVPYQAVLMITMIVCAVLSAGWALAVERTMPEPSAVLGMSLLVTTLFSTILALYLQNRFQGFTTATRAALIFAAEPVFAALFSWFSLGELLDGTGLAGAALILTAVLITEVGGKPTESGERPEMKVIFLCTANSCRSQMAEAWARELFPAKWEAASAGLVTYPITARTREAMAAAGVSMDEQKSKSLDSFDLDDFDLVVTLSDEAGRFLPALADPTRHLHAPLDDPMSFRGTDSEVAAAFATARDLIRNTVAAVVADRS